MTLNIDLISTGQAAKILDCSNDNVRRLVRMGKLAVAAIVGKGQRLLDREVVEELARLRANAVPASGRHRWTSDTAAQAARKGHLSSGRRQKKR